MEPSTDEALRKGCSGGGRSSGSPQAVGLSTECWLDGTSALIALGELRAISKNTYLRFPGLTVRCLHLLCRAGLQRKTAFQIYLSPEPGKESPFHSDLLPRLLAGDDNPAPITQ